MSEPPYSLKKCIVLIGCMGCGKSTIGQQLHEETGLAFIDTDHFIEENENKTVKEIFEEQGETYFRDLETSVLKTLLSEPLPEGCIISTGGGIVVREENRKLIQQLGYVVWLNLSPEFIYQHICHNRTRPLLHTENPLETLREIAHKRKDFYRSCADLVIDTSTLTIPEAACGIIESARHYFSQRHTDVPALHIPPHTQK